MSCTLTIIEPAGAAPAAETALRRARDALDRAERRAQPFEMVQALVALARCYREEQAGDVAEVLFEQALVWARTTTSTDLVVEVLCELCEFSAERALFDADVQDAAERARAHGSEIVRLAPGVADPVFEAATLLRVSEIHAVLGDEAEALALRERAQRSTVHEVPYAEAPAIAAIASPTLH